MAAHGPQHRFDRLHGIGAFARLRSMLGDPQLAYQHIAKKFGFTRQYIAQLAKELGINGRRPPTGVRRAVSLASSKWNTRWGFLG
jgi:hypothetical protein